MTAPKCVRCDGPARIERCSAAIGRRLYCAACFLALGEVEPGTVCAFIQYPDTMPGPTLVAGQWQQTTVRQSHGTMIGGDHG